MLRRIRVTALEQITPDGKVTVLAGNTTRRFLEGDTSAAFWGGRERDTDNFVCFN